MTVSFAEKFGATEDFDLTAQMVALAGGFPVFSTDISPVATPKTFDLVVTRKGTTIPVGDNVYVTPDSTIKTLSNQAWALGTNWFDTLQTDYQWDPEAEDGYNFRYHITNSVIFATTPAVVGAIYRFEFTARTQTQGTWVFGWDMKAT